MRFQLLIPLLLLSGCATYNYDVVKPENSRVRVGKEWQRVAAGPVAYRMIAKEGHLVVLVYNQTAEAMRVLGDRSYIVTPANQSVPLQTQVIAPGSYMKLVMPPLEQIIRPGPSIGFGVGYSTGRVYPGRHYYRPGYYSEPTYLYVESPSTYWEWEGETDATVHFVLEQGDKTFDQTFVFHRVKV